jgi:hypothetical protein
MEAGSSRGEEYVIQKILYRMQALKKASVGAHYTFK